MVKYTFSLIICDPEIVFSLCLACKDPEIKFSHVCQFFIKIMGIWVSMVTKIGDMVPNLPVKNVLLTFQMEQNGTFLDNFKYDYWILHKKLP